MEYIKIPPVDDTPVVVNCKFGFDGAVENHSMIVMSTLDAPGQGKYFPFIKLELFGRELFIGGDFFTNWRNVYRHPIIWFLSK